MSVANPFTVSVAVCTYQGELYLNAQLESIARQSRLPDEVVIFDDASKDTTNKLSTEFAEAASFPVKVEVNPHQLGVAKNFERAIAACSGDIIVLADQDDVWHSEKLVTLCQIFEKRPDAALVFSDAEVVDHQLSSLGYSFWESLGFGRAEQDMVQHGEALTVFLRRNVVAGCTMAFRSKFRDMFLPIDQAYPHDAWIVSLLASVGSVVLTGDRLIQYRQHEKNVCGARKESGVLSDRMKTAAGVTAQEYLVKAGRYQLLEERLTECKSYNTSRACREINACIRHLKTRGLLADPKTPWAKRYSKIASELMNRHYFLYSHGWRSLFKDMFGQWLFR